MSSAFARSLAHHLEQLVIGPPLYAPDDRLPNMLVVPLYPSQLHADPPDMVTLSEAMRRGVRLHDTGMVSRVHVDNPLPTTVLAGESEILLGPTQLRAVQFSCLIPPERRVALPVSCVEEGQPTRYQAEFNATDACPLEVRGHKMAQLAESGEPPQYWLWDSIRTFLQASRTVSTTHDLHSVLDRNAHALSRLAEHFPCYPGQVGAVCAVGPHLFLELFGDPEILEDRYSNLLRSALVEAVARPGDQAVSPDLVAQFLRQVAEASENGRLLESRGMRDSGKAVAFSQNNVAGMALVAHGQLVHLAAHQTCVGFDRRLAAMRAELDSSRQEWEAANEGFLDDLTSRYADRRERYRAFKEKLRPVQGPAPAGPADTQTAPAPPSTGPAPARPVPLSPGLHGFFLRLFRRP